MSELAVRLTWAVSRLLERFKLQPDGPYAGLSLTETAIVALIAEAPTPVIQRAVGERLNLPKTTMTSAVQRLEERGLLTRAPSPEDARARVLVLTAPGIALARALQAAQLQASEAMLQALAPEDRATLVRLLEQIARAEGTGG